MLLGILADTHNQFDRTRRAVELLRAEGAEALIHAGDLNSEPIVGLISVLPAWFVFGNHDADTVPELKNATRAHNVQCLEWGGIIELVGKRIGVVHGHMSVDLRRVLALQPHYLFSGHSHIASDTVVNGVRRINPGALHRAEEFTVSLLNLENDELRFLLVT